MSTENDLISMVRQLVAAENEAGENGKQKFDAILSPEFTQITRSSGKEENRENLLQAVAHPANPDRMREIDENEFWVRQTAGLGVVRSLVRTRERSNPQVISGRFRNIHIFERGEGGRWGCIIWQVTKLE